MERRRDNNNGNRRKLTKKWERKPLE
jgi:hypothetical protein